MSRSWRSWLCEEIEAAMLSVPERCSDPPCAGTACRSPHYGDFQAMAAAAMEATFKWLARPVNAPASERSEAPEGSPAAGSREDA